MLSDLSSLDIFTLTVNTDWTQAEKDDLVKQYDEALAGYLEDQLRGLLSDTDVEELTKLLENEKLTTDEVVDFYHSKIPGLTTKIELIGLEFKKLFLLRFYQRYIDDITQELKVLRDEYTQTEDDSNKKAVTDLTHILIRWEHLLQLATQDKWKEVAKTLEDPLSQKN